MTVNQEACESGQLSLTKARTLEGIVGRRCDVMARVLELEEPSCLSHSHASVSRPHHHIQYSLCHHWHCLLLRSDACTLLGRDEIERTEARFAWFPIHHLLSVAASARPHRHCSPMPVTLPIITSTMSIVSVRRTKSPAAPSEQTNSLPRSNRSANPGASLRDLANLPPPEASSSSSRDWSKHSTSRERKGLVLFSGDLYSPSGREQRHKRYPLGAGHQCHEPRLRVPRQP